MRVVDRKAFLQLPAGTIYAKGVPWAFGEGLCVKAETLPSNNWIYLNPCGIEADDSTQDMARLDEMLASGVSYPMAESFGRDGYFDDDAVFLIFEQADLVRMRGYIEIALRGTL